MKLYYFTLIIQSWNIEIPEKLLQVYPSEVIQNWDCQLLNESAYITEYVMRAMNAEFDFDCRRINFVCTNKELRKGIRKFESVHELDVPFQMDYFLYTPEQKQQYLFEVVYKGIQLLCEYKQWDFSLFEKHLIALRDGGFHVEFYLDKRQCRQGNTTAKVFGVQTMTETTFYVDFFQKRKLIARKPLMVTPTDCMRYRYSIDDIAWVNDTTVAVSDFLKRNVFYVSMDM